MPLSPDIAGLTFGVEIECYLPEGQTHATGAEAVAHRLAPSGQTCKPEAWNHIQRPYWKLVTDGSLSDYTRGAEFVAPILSGAAGLDQVDTVMHALSDLGATVAKNCGFHVHVGVGTNPPLDFWKRLVSLYSVYEPVLDSLMPPSRRESRASLLKSIKSASPAAVKAAPSYSALLDVATPKAGGADHKYYKLNLSAWKKYHTVEFRHHSGTLDSKKARQWIIACLRMVAAARRENLPVGAAVQTRNGARVNSKAWKIGEMFFRPEGVTGREVCTAMNWPSVSMPQQAKMCGIEFTTQRTGREVRYFANAAAAAPEAPPVTVDGFAQIIGASDEERDYMRQRVNDLSGPVQWAA